MNSSEKKRRLIDQIISLGETESLKIRPVMPEEWLRLELTMPQLKVVLWLYCHGVSRVSEIATALGSSQAVASGVLDRLVHHGLVEREGDPADRRVVLCRLSSDGWTLAERLWLSGLERGRQLLEVMDIEELEKVRDALEIVFRVLRQLDGGGWP